MAVETLTDEARAVLKANQLPQSLFRQIAGFTEASLRQVYQGSLRQTMTGLGYADRRVTVSDPQSLAALRDRAEQRAQSIIDTTNRMMENALSRGEPIDGFWDKVRAYNANVLVPHDTAWARNQAAADFHARNGIETQWNAVNATGGCERICAEYVAGGPYSESDWEPPPYHQDCSCQPESTTVALNLPDESDLWLG